MSIPPLKISDYVTAAVPVGATEVAHSVAKMSLSDWEIITRMGTTLAGFLLGAAFLIWRWRREARKSTNHPFSRD